MPGTSAGYFINNFDKTTKLLMVNLSKNNKTTQGEFIEIQLGFGTDFLKNVKIYINLTKCI